MSHAIVWMGPVSRATLRPVQLPAGWDVLTISDVVRPRNRDPAQGLVPQDFRNWYTAHLGTSDDPLGTLLGGADDCILASFSAGHGLLELLLGRHAGDPRILGVLSADSYFSHAILPGYQAHAEACAADAARGPFWLTTSASPSGSVTGSSSVAAFADVLALQDVPRPEGMPPPVRCQGRGGVLWLDYGTPGDAQSAHVRQATLIAPAVLNLWFDHAQPAAGPAGASGGVVIALCGAMAILFGGR